MCFIYVHFIFTFQLLVHLPSLPPITDSSHIVNLKSGLVWE